MAEGARSIHARSRLREARAFVPAILAEQAASLSARDGELRAADAQITSTGMAVVEAAGPDGGPRFVIKLPATPQAAEGLRRESDVLAELHADDRLGEWRDLIPLPLAEGEARGRPYRVDAALPGSAPLGPTRESDRGRLLEAAAETIEVLHTSTASATEGDRALAERWVDAPLEDLWPRPPRRGGLRARIERLRDELHGALLGGIFSTSWIHGDYWLGNLLLSGESVTGIVDWDAAAPDEPALHDVLHLVLSTRRMATGDELGTLVRAHLRGAPWPEEERRLLERHAGWGHDGVLPERHALLLYWLRQVAAHARQQSGRSGPRYRVWERRNVHRVLAEL
jgi:hypothetical protein